MVFLKNISSLLSNITVVAMVLFLISCEEPRTTEGLAIPQPNKLEKVGGDNQTGIVGARADLNLTVKVLSEENKPVRNVKVSFRVSRGTGSFVDSLIKTDNQGVARGVFNFGKSVGDIVVLAEVNGLKNSPIDFSLKAKEDVASAFRFIGGKNQSAFVNTTIDLQFITVDQFDNVVPLVPLTFLIIGIGGGSTSVSSAVSDSQGFFRMKWTLGTLAGQQLLKIIGIDSRGMEFFETINAFANPTRAETMTIYDGNLQTGIRGAQLPKTFSVNVKDIYGNVTNHGFVQLNSVVGNGFPPDPTLLIGLNGIAQTVFSLATDTNVNVVEATLFSQFRVPFAPPPIKKNTITFTQRGLFPLVLQSVTKSSQFIDIVWEGTQNPDFKQYKLYRSTVPNVQAIGTPLVIVTTKSQTTATDSTSIAGQTYFYKLFLELTDGYVLPSNELSIATIK